MKIVKKFTATALAVMLIASMIVSVPFTASAFNVNNYKAEIKEIHIGAPITGTDEKKYLPVTVKFTANEDLGDTNAVYFLEGYLKGMLANGDKFEGISGLGMTLMGPLKPDALEGAGSNAFSWMWSEGYGEGVLKYNIPLKEDSDTQTVEQSAATGQQEVNCVKEGDKIAFSIETVMNSSNIPPDMLPEGGSLFSDERTITIEDSSKYPKTIEFDNEATATITVHYVYAEGGQAAPDAVETYDVGDEYTILSPDIEGYYPDMATVFGTCESDEEYTVTYIKNLPDLSKATVTGLSGDENKKYTEEEVKSFGLEGLVKGEDYTTSITKENSKWIVTFKPVEGKSTGERVVEVEQENEAVATITVHYVYAEGGQAAPDAVETYDVGDEYTILSPDIEGYYPDMATVFGTCESDEEYTVTYIKNLPDLSKATVTGLSGDENKKYTEEEVKSFGLEGLVKGEDYTTSITKENSKWIVTFKPVEGKSTGERVVEVEQENEATATITVHYVYADGSQAAPDAVKTFEVGFTNFVIESPKIEGYTPDKEAVTGIPSENKEYTVTYIKNETSETTIQAKAVKTNIKVGETTKINVDVQYGAGDTKFTSETPKVVTVSKDGVVKGVGAGKGTIVVENNGVKKKVTLNVTKKANTMTVKAKTVKAKAAKKTAVKKSKAFTIRNAKGKVTFKKVKGNKKIKISKNGKITIKKGLKKGKTYKLKVKVTANGNSVFAAKSKTVTVKIKVK